MSQPWDETLAAAWRTVTKGRRKYVFYPLFAVFVAVGLLSTIVDGLRTIGIGFKPRCVSKTNEYRPAERDVLDEWVLRISGFDSEAQAEDDRARFVAAMFRDRIRPSLPPNANEEKVLVVRDPEHCGRWLEVLDLVPGDGSEESQRRWRDSLNRLGPVDPGSEMSRWIRPSRPYYYSREKYERMYGKVEENQR